MEYGADENASRTPANDNITMTSTSRSNCKPRCPILNMSCERSPFPAFVYRCLSVEQPEQLLVVPDLDTKYMHTSEHKNSNSGMLTLRDYQHQGKRQRRGKSRIGLLSNENFTLTHQAAGILSNASYHISLSLI
jgi:hypothetical protein